MNKKKGYPRKPYSFERVLKDLADDIGYENIETVIDKKRKAIEHISNPNFKDRQLHIQDGLELDIHCKKIGKGTPFVTAYETLLKKEIQNKIKAQIELTRNVETSPKNTTLYFNILLKTKEINKVKFNIVEEFYNTYKQINEV